MNIERIPERLAKWVVILVGLLLSFIVGQKVGNGQFGFVALVILILVVGGLALAVPDRLWLAVPLAWPLAGQIPALGIPGTVRDLIVASVFAIFFLLIAFKIVRRRPEMSFLDVLLWLTGFYLVIAFIRNPVGVAALDSDRVGGRPYFNVMIGFLAYWILRRSAISPSSSKRFAFWITLARALEGFVAIALTWIPALAILLATYYTSPTFSWAVDPDSAATQAPIAESTARQGYLAFAGLPVAVYLITVYRPLSCVNPLNKRRFAAFSFGITCILLSGFRSSLMSLGMYGLLSSYFHRGRNEVWRLAGIALLSMLFLSLAQGTILNLPRSAQRALSFLPGNWDSFSVEEAKESTNWRVEMWVEMLTTNKYIDSHSLGDGFGFKRIDLERMQAKRLLGLDPDQADFMTSGGVHSGPVSAIRYVGYVGLSLHLVLLGAIARFAWQMVRKAKGTNLQALVYLISIPCIVEPFFFTLVFGSYENSVPDSFFAVGMLKMLKNSMEMAERNPDRGEIQLPDFDVFDPTPKPVEPTARI